MFGKMRSLRFGGSIFLSYQAVKATHRPLGTVHLYNIDSQQLAKQEFMYKLPKILYFDLNF